MLSVVSVHVGTLGFMARKIERVADGADVSSFDDSTENTMKSLTFTLWLMWLKTGRSSVQDRLLPQAFYTSDRWMFYYFCFVTSVVVVSDTVVGDVVIVVHLITLWYCVILTLCSTLFYLFLSCVILTVLFLKHKCTIIIQWSIHWILMFAWSLYGFL